MQAASKRSKPQHGCMSALRSKSPSSLSSYSRPPHGGERKTASALSVGSRPAGEKGAQ